MKIEHTTVYVGPNIWTRRPAIEVMLDLGQLEDWPTGRLGEGFQQALLAALPGLRDHRCSYRVPGGFVRRLTEDEGTWLGHVLEHASIELQYASGSSVTFGRARGVPGRPGVYRVVYEYADREVGIAASQLALRLIHSLLPPELRPLDAEPSFDFGAAYQEFLALARRRQLGPSTLALVRAAERRNVPWERLDGDHLIQFGQGARQRRIHASVTDHTAQIGVEIAHDKALTNQLLAGQGIPVPGQRRVYDEEEAVVAAAEFGYPVVVKPLDGNQGRGVQPDVRDANEVREAFRAAREEGSGVLVEQRIAGFDHRLLVVGGTLVAASRRVPGHVVGDGSSTIAALVAQVNADPRRGEGHDAVLTRLELDEEAGRLLARRGYTRDSVPPPGEVVYLRATANLSRGGTAIDVTDQVHPDNRLLAERAARTVGLDVAGVDFIAGNIARSHLEQHTGVCEVNAAPGLRMHLAPSEGNARAVADAIIESMYPGGRSARIPIAAITGTNGKTTTAHMVAAIAAAAGRRVGLSTTNGVYIRGHLVTHADSSGPASARMILRDPAVDCAVLETARGGILREGLGFRSCTVGAVLNITNDHLGIDGINTPEEMARVKRTVVAAATDSAVLNADDPLCVGMIEHTRAHTTCLVSMHSENPLIDRHVAAGGTAVVVEQNRDLELVFRHGAKRTHLIAARVIPATHDGQVTFNVQNAAFAAAIALGMGFGPRTIREGLRGFEASIDRTPGRLNVYDGHPFRVIMDYGHNPAAVRAMCEAARRLSSGGRIICVISGPGDRRDDDIRDIARAAAGRCDQYVCRRDDSLRGRGPSDVPRLLREGLLSSGVAADRIRVVPEETEAMAVALGMAKPGDLLLLFADDVARTWNQIVRYRPRLVVSPRSVVAVPRKERRLAVAQAGA